MAWACRGCYVLEVIFGFPGTIGLLVPAFPFHLEARLALNGTSVRKVLQKSHRKETHVVGNVVGKYLFDHVPAHLSVARVNRSSQLRKPSLILVHVVVILVLVIFLINIAIRDFGIGNIIVLRDVLLLLDRLAPTPLLRQDIARHGKIADVGVLVVADSYSCKNDQPVCTRKRLPIATSSRK